MKLKLFIIAILCAFCLSETHTWRAAAKDHIRPDSSTITTYVIGIKRYIANVGNLDVEVIQRQSDFTAHADVSIAMDKAYALVGGAVEK